MRLRFALPAVFALVSLVSVAAAAEPTLGKGVVNSVDAAGHKVNLSHEPIPSIGWPAMKMNFPVAPAVDLKGMKAGTRVEFTLEKNQAGTYEIQSITPAGK